MLANIMKGTHRHLLLFIVYVYVLSCKIRVTESYWEQYKIDSDVLALFMLSCVQLLHTFTDLQRLAHWEV
jgi:hypothetical protein